MIEQPPDNNLPDPSDFENPFSRAWADFEVDLHDAFIALQATQIAAEKERQSQIRTEADDLKDKALQQKEAGVICLLANVIPAILGGSALESLLRDSLSQEEFYSQSVFFSICSFGAVVLSAAGLAMYKRARQSNRTARVLLASIDNSKLLGNQL